MKLEKKNFLTQYPKCINLSRVINLLISVYFLKLTLKMCKLLVKMFLMKARNLSSIILPRQSV